jgi:hypothetical protein
MNVEFRDLSEAENSPLARNCDAEELLGLLRERRPSTPRFCSMRTADGTLTIGVGEEGCVQFTSPDAAPPYLMAAPIEGRPEGSSEFLEFLAGGTPSQVPRQFALPWTVVEQVVRTFIETGRRSEHVSWVSI